MSKEELRAIIAELERIHAALDPPNAASTEETADALLSLDTVIHDAAPLYVLAARYAKSCGAAQAMVGRLRERLVNAVLFDVPLKL